MSRAVEPLGLNYLKALYPYYAHIRREALVVDASKEAKDIPVFDLG